MSKHSTKGGRSARFEALKVHLDEAGPALTSQGGLAPVIHFLSHLGFSALWSDQVLRRLAGWPRVPDETTLGSALQRGP
jgi:hypothetical protein